MRPHASLPHATIVVVAFFSGPFSPLLRGIGGKAGREDGIDPQFAPVSSPAGWSFGHLSCLSHTLGRVDIVIVVHSFGTAVSYDGPLLCSFSRSNARSS